MKTVKITIEVDVPDDCVSAAVDRIGNVFGFSDDADPRPGDMWHTWSITRGYEKVLHVTNWRDTLTEVG